MPGDIIAMPSAYHKALSLFLVEQVDGVITLSPELDAVDTHGVGIIEESRVVHLQWPSPAITSNKHLRDMTIWSSDKRIFNMIEEYPNPGKSISYVFMDAVCAGRSIAGNLYTEPWIHLGYPEDLQKSILNFSPSM